MFELAQCFGFDLPDTFAGHVELLADFFKRMIGVHADAETHSKHALFTRRQGCQNARRGFLQIGMDRRIQGLNGIFIFDEITKGGIFLVDDRRFK